MSVQYNNQRQHAWVLWGHNSHIQLTSSSFFLYLCFSSANLRNRDMQYHSIKMTEKCSFVWTVLHEWLGRSDVLVFFHPIQRSSQIQMFHQLSAIPSSTMEIQHFYSLNIEYVGDRWWCHHSWWLKYGYCYTNILHIMNSNIILHIYIHAHWKNSTVPVV